jgi:hypothetical protein
MSFKLASIRCEPKYDFTRQIVSGGAPESGIMFKCLENNDRTRQAST